MSDKNEAIPEFLRFLSPACGLDQSIFIECHRGKVFADYALKTIKLCLLRGDARAADMDLFNAGWSVIRFNLSDVHNFPKQFRKFIVDHVTWLASGRNSTPLVLVFTPHPEAPVKIPVASVSSASWIRAASTAALACVKDWDAPMTHHGDKISLKKAFA